MLPRSLRPRALVFPLVLAAIAALAACASAPEANRDLATEYYNLGNAYLELGKHAKAVDAYRHALRLDPGLSRAGYNLAIALGRMGESSEAVGLLEKLAADDPGNVTVLMALAWAYHGERKDAEALKLWEEVASLAPENRDALYNAGVVLWSQGDQSQAIDHFRRLLAIAPDDADVLYNIGAILLEMGDTTGAVGYLGRYVERKPTDGPGLLLLADAYERQRAFADALELYERLVSADAQSALGWFGKARLELTVVEDPDTGFTDLKKALDLGFHDEAAFRALLGTEGLVKRSEVEQELQTRGLLPPGPGGGTVAPGPVPAR